MCQRHALCHQRSRISLGGLFPRLDGPRMRDSDLTEIKLMTQGPLSENRSIQRIGHQEKHTLEMPIEKKLINWERLRT